MNPPPPRPMLVRLMPERRLDCPPSPVPCAIESPMMRTTGLVFPVVNGRPVIAMGMNRYEGDESAMAPEPGAVRSVVTTHPPVPLAVEE